MTNWNRAAQDFVREYFSGPRADERAVQLVRQYQSRSGLKVDGQAGEKTFGHLRRVVVAPIDEGTRINPTPDPKVWEGWVHPMGIIVDTDGNRHRPEISSGFTIYGRGEDPDRRNHWGGDLMYRRHPLDGGPAVSKAGKYYWGPKRAPTHDKWYYCPHSVDCYAVGPGTIYRVRYGSNNNVLIDHHDVPGFGPLTTWYQHLHEIHVNEGEPVTAGQLIGTVGAGSTYLNHLHFEFRDYNRGKPINDQGHKRRRDVVVNPRPYLSLFRMLDDVG